MANGNKKFTADDICNIIKASINTNISYIKVADLEISFCKDTEVKITPTDLAIEQSEEIEVSNKPFYDVDLEALEMENLMIEDPLEYEKRLGEYNG